MMKRLLAVFLCVVLLAAPHTITVAATEQSRATRYIYAGALGTTEQSVKLWFHWHKTSGGTDGINISYTTGSLSDNVSLVTRSFADSGVDWTSGITLDVLSSAWNAAGSFALYLNSYGTGTPYRTADFVFNTATGQAEYRNAYTWTSSQDIRVSVRLYTGITPTPTPIPPPTPTPTTYHYNNDLVVGTPIPQSGTAIAYDDIDVDGNSASLLSGFVGLFWSLCPWLVGALCLYIGVGFFRRLLKG